MLKMIVSNEEKEVTKDERWKSQKCCNYFDSQSQGPMP
jgi:hypothetical protein